MAQQLLHLYARTALERNIMNRQTMTAKASAQQTGKLRTALWLATLLLALPFAATAQDTAATDANAETNVQWMANVATTALSDEALQAAHAKGLNWGAPAVPTLSVILWDESGNIRRTGSGQSLADVSGSTGTVSISWK